MSMFQVFALTLGAEWGALGLVILLLRHRARRRMVARMFAGNPDKDGEK